MQSHYSTIMLVLVIALLAGQHSESLASPPPLEEKPAVNSPSGGQVPLDEPQKLRWDLHKNFAHGMSTKSKDGKQFFRAVRAVDVSKLDQTQRRETPEDVPVADPNQPSPFALWLKKFPDPDLQPTNGYASVVDENVFTDLRMVNGQDAAKLDQDWIIIGQVKLKEYDPIELVKFLVTSGIVNANLHIMATVTGSHFSSEQGHWFSLHSDDPYWTNQENQASYNFGIHIAKDGTIRLINPKDVGNLPEQESD